METWNADPWLVMLSIAVSVFASFTALNLSGRLIAAEPGARRWWIFAAALALGGGTWAMHFIGILSMAMPATYDLDLTLLSLVIPIVASGIGFYVVSGSGAQPRPLIGSGVLMGSGIVAMHYVGMSAIRIPNTDIVYDAWLTAMSVAIALVAATAALWLSFHTERSAERMIASLSMGMAISGMHYTGMAAATFRMGGHPAIQISSIQPAILALAVAGVATFLSLLALVTAYFDRALASLTAREAAALRASEERFRSMIESTSDIIGIVDATGTFLYENFSTRSLLGYLPEEMTGRGSLPFVLPEALGEARNFLARVRESRGVAVTVELPLLHRSGERREFEIVATNLFDVPAVQGILVNLRDITERKRLVAQLETLSETDILTGALNRRGFSRMANGVFERLRRAGRQGTIIMVDVDHFKAVNDRYGHAAGDLVLGKIAEACRAHLRPSDLFGRFGGEEFVVLMPDADAGEASALAERLLGAIAESNVWSIKGSVSVTASFGITTFDPARVELEGALARADEALYEAKNAGRNCIRVRA